MSLKTPHILLLNGPNLHLLGKREPHIYGTTTLSDIENRLSEKANAHGIKLTAFQSNHEGDIVDKISELGLLADSKSFDAIIINPAAFTHTSVAIRDALLAADKPFIEVHLSNIHAREPFRTHSYFSDKAVGVICGLGDLAYDMALAWFIEHFKQDTGV
ncbi:type II 3-dehydroquinate dehydratase [Moraxella sp. Pampa]|uniref:type II 3-dehydroquinate dehydratase n=1 Tax=Moraxella sp. Pampa TaxID=3111978 RepID=UPI002B40736E|nr:type II 3-dehydroquinate dehydratase [Moraxella sp. Pampa]